MQERPAVALVKFADLVGSVGRQTPQRRLHLAKKHARHVPSRASAGSSLSDARSYDTSTEPWAAWVYSSEGTGVDLASSPQPKHPEANNESDPQQASVADSAVSDDPSTWHKPRRSPEQHLQVGLRTKSEATSSKLERKSVETRSKRFHKRRVFMAVAVNHSTERLEKGAKSQEPLLNVLRGLQDKVWTSSSCKPAALNKRILIAEETQPKHPEDNLHEELPELQELKKLEEREAALTLRIHRRQQGRGCPSKVAPAAPLLRVHRKTSSRGSHRCISPSKSVSNNVRPLLRSTESVSCEGSMLQVPKPSTGSSPSSVTPNSWFVIPEQGATQSAEISSAELSESTQQPILAAKAKVSPKKSPSMKKNHAHTYGSSGVEAQESCNLAQSCLREKVSCSWCSFLDEETLRRVGEANHKEETSDKRTAQVLKKHVKKLGMLNMIRRFNT